MQCELPMLLHSTSPSTTMGSALMRLRRLSMRISSQSQLSTTRPSIVPATQWYHRPEAAKSTPPPSSLRQQAVPWAHRTPPLLLPPLPLHYVFPTPPCLGKRSRASYVCDTGLGLTNTAPSPTRSGAAVQSPTVAMYRVRCCCTKAS